MILELRRTANNMIVDEAVDHAITHQASAIAIGFGLEHTYINECVRLLFCPNAGF